jgi:hypothetical protein
MAVTEDSVIEELLDRYPDLNRVFIRFKLPCLICYLAASL